MSLDEVLDAIRSRPGIILGQKSVDILDAFLTGFTYATKDPNDLHFLSGFTDWVRRRYRVKSSQGWAKIISFHSADAADGLNLFWNLLDEYRNRGGGAADSAGFTRQGRSRQRGGGSPDARPPSGREGKEKAG